MAAKPPSISFFASQQRSFSETKIDPHPPHRPPGIALVIADEDGAAQSRFQIVLRLKEQSRFRLRAFAAIVPAVWAIVNRAI